MTKTSLLVAFVLLAAAGPAAPQAPAPAPSDAKASPQPPAQPAPKLNLKLDNPAQYSRETPREGGGSPDVLPSLGADARTMEKAAPLSGSRTSPYPAEPSAGR
ncbi:MAG TPA: hypothetical protein VIG70_11085 [Burkholderiales bacterium]|jgi:hypothetical protein